MKNSELKNEGQREDNIKPGLLPTGDTLICRWNKYIAGIAVHIVAYFKLNLYLKSLICLGM